MNFDQMIENMRLAHIRAHNSLKTKNAYEIAVRKYKVWCDGIKGTRTFETEQHRAAAYLNSIADTGVSRSTQKQHLCALKFMYEKGLGIEMGELPGFRLARKSRHLPVWVTRREAAALFEHMRGPSLEIAQIMYGAGLRTTECRRLRIRDIDMDNCLINIKGGKGRKDRASLLPHSMIDTIRARIKESRYTWEQDQRNHLPPVWTPDAVSRKYPNYGSKWEWFWLWPGRYPVTDKATGIRRRHHVHESAITKAINTAVTRSKLGKHVTAHSFRHGFATALLLNGTPLTEIQELLGHKDLASTEIYLHCLPRLASRVQSPLDHQPDIIPFTQSIIPANGKEAIS